MAPSLILKVSCNGGWFVCDSVPEVFPQPVSQFSESFANILFVALGAIYAVYYVCSFTASPVDYRFEVIFSFGFVAYDCL